MRVSWVGAVNLVLGWKPNPIDDAEYREDETSVANGSKTWWEVLGVDEKAPTHEIHHAYRTKIRKYHPDRVTGLGEEFGKLAELRAKELNTAFAEAKRQRGQSDEL